MTYEKKVGKKHKSVGILVWDTFGGYKVKSKKWAGRRSKVAMRMTKSFVDDPHISSFRNKAKIKVDSPK